MDRTEKPRSGARRRRWIPLAAVVALLAVSAAGGWLLLRDGEVAAGTATPTSSSGGIAPLDPSRAAVLSAQLTSGDEAQLRGVLALPSGQALQPGAVREFASLGPVTFDLGTFAYIDERTAEVRGTVANAAWTFTLLHNGTDWMLVNGSPIA